MTERGEELSGPIAPLVDDGGGVGADSVITNVSLHIFIDSPQDGATIESQAGGVPINVTGTAMCLVNGEENIGFIEKIEVRLGSGGTIVQATPTGPQRDWSFWSFTATTTVIGSLNITAMATSQAYGPSRIRATASDSASVQILDDRTAPTLVVNEPPDNFTKLAEDETGAWVTISGWATDTQSGVDIVEWALDGATQYNRATPQQETPQPIWDSWSTRIKVPPDFHTIRVRARDKKNNVSADVMKPVRVSRSYTPQDQEDNVSRLAYLRDLVEFARSHVTVTVPGSQPRNLKLEDLAQEFFQPFGDLTSDEQVRQLRVCIEVLRKFLAPPPADALAHWKFDEGSGNTTADATGNGSTGMLQGGPTWSSGRVGARALDFDGVDDYVQVGAAAKLVMKNSLSICAWIHPKGPGSSAAEGGIIVSKEGEYGVARFPDGTIRWAFANSSPGWGWIDTGYVALANQWIHVAVVYDNGTTKTYANGRLVHTHVGSGAIGDVDTTRNDFRIGGRQSTPQHFRGLIDEVRIFSRPLGAQEVASLATPPTRLVAHWKFDEGSGTTTADATGNGSTGTLQPSQGGPTWGSGRVGARALDFDGANDVVRLRDANARDVINNFTVAFWANPQATHEIDTESTDGTSGTSGQRYAIDPQQGGARYGSPAHACAGVSVGTNGISVYEHSDGYMPALLVHEAPVSGWTHIAVVYKDKHPGLYVNGTLVKSGLKSLKNFVHMNPQALGGMVYGFFRGQLDDVRVYDHVLSGREIADLAGVPLATEDGYRQTAYRTLLNRVGTSYEELRLARHRPHEGEETRKTLEETRKALAERLGIDFDTAWADRLDDLLLEPHEITEAALEKLFGLADSTRDPLSARPVPDLLSWQLEHLRTLWKKQDHPTGQDADSVPPIIDPDLVRQEDLIAPTPGKPNPAFTLWQARSNWVSQRLSQLAAITGTNAEARLKLLVESTPQDAAEKLSMADLLALDEQRKQGTDIQPELQRKRLSNGAFSYLIRMHKLAVAGSLLDSEWSDVYSILVRVEKLHKHRIWRSEEINLALSTDYFNLPADATTIAPASPKLPAWRATERERRAWQNKLRARADQELAVVQGLQAAVDATEEATLPLLRDAMVAAVGAPASDGGQSGADVLNWLADWLQIDVKSTGRQMTTRINQAIETVQGILFSLRANRFKDVETELDLISVYPRPDWKLAVNASDFDQEWAWMGSYATWRAAMLVFLYPENLLLPSLRKNPTNAFQEQLLDKLRGNHQLTPKQAREAASNYLTSLLTAWVEDEVPAGATTAPPGPQQWGIIESWNWVAENPAPFSGGKAHQSTTYDGIHQHYFHGATNGLRIEIGDVLFAYVYLDPANRPSEVMLQWDDGTGWEHRAYWGANQIQWGTDGTASRRRMGDLPEAGKWVRLEVPANQVGLEGKTVRGMAFTLFGGRATWDQAGLSLPQELKAADFKITDQLSERDLSNRYNMVKRLFGNITNPHDAPVYLKEVFYFVPMYLALQLQKSRQYTAALDWFRTVYAYDLPVNQRKIYYGLELEDSRESYYTRVPTKWLLGDDLNPHVIVARKDAGKDAGRANAYTRFTLLSMVRCFLDFADSEFTNEAAESIPRARTLYLSALDLLNMPELQPKKPERDAGFAPNPIPKTLRLHAELNLFKLRDDRNIAGMQRQIKLPVPQRAVNSLPTAGGGGQLTRPGVGASRPTPYRYSALVERAKHLVALAQQIEVAYLSALEKKGAEEYTVLKARQDLDLAKAGVELQNLRVTEANGGVTLATLQQQRSRFQFDHYNALITEGMSGLEYASVIAQWAEAASSSALATMASYERRRQEWEFQRSLADKDIAIGAQQVKAAWDRKNVVNKELSIAETQDTNANATVNFLTTMRFTTAELYEWMSGILGRVYDYFLQQATATARLAQSQLAFERQKGVLSIIQPNYWQAPSEGGNTAGGSSDGKAPDRRGLTGSARLLQDIYQLDQYAFETDERKLQLTKTISLARTAPIEFQRFRETGVLPFATPMEMFDWDFPGHYLRLIKRVRTSVIALVPPTQGIRATLATTGVSYVATSGNGGFQPVPVYRDPELVALSSPNNATGLFELEQQSDMLLPFEAMGVDASWELQMPKAANPFDYRTIADVLVTIEYTALNSFDYRRQVIQGLDRTVSADRPFSFRQQFADQWYDLHNPDQASPPAMTVSFDTMREDFPPSIEDLTIQHVVLYVVRSEERTFAKSLAVDLRFAPLGGSAAGGGASSKEGVFSTRRGNATSWIGSITGKPANGTWTLTLPDTQTEETYTQEEVKKLFEDEEIEDILFVITYSGTTPEWPS